MSDKLRGKTLKKKDEKQKRDTGRFILLMLTLLGWLLAGLLTLQGTKNFEVAMIVREVLSAIMVKLASVPNFGMPGLPGLGMLTAVAALTALVCGLLSKRPWQGIGTLRGLLSLRGEVANQQEQQLLLDQAIGLRLMKLTGQRARRSWTCFGGGCALAISGLGCGISVWQIGGAPLALLPLIALVTLRGMWLMCWTMGPSANTAARSILTTEADLDMDSHAEPSALPVRPSRPALASRRAAVADTGRVWSSLHVPASDFPREP